LLLLPLLLLLTLDVTLLLLLPLPPWLPNSPLTPTPTNGDHLSILVHAYPTLVKILLEYPRILAPSISRSVALINTGVADVKIGTSAEFTTNTGKLVAVPTVAVAATGVSMLGFVSAGAVAPAFVPA